MLQRIILLILALSILFPAFVSAEEVEETEGGVLGEEISEMEEKPGLAERMVAEIIISPVNWLLNILGMVDPIILVFGKNPSQDETGFLQGSCAGSFECSDGLILGVFEPELMASIDALYRSFERFTPFPLVIALLIIAFLILYKGASTDDRSRIKDYAAAFLIGIVALRFGYYVWIFSAKVVTFFTDLIWATLMDAGIEPSLFLEMFWGSRNGYESAMSLKSLGLALLILLAAVSVIVINYQYIVRQVMLMVLIVLFPVTCVLTVFPRFRHAMQIWWEEFISNLILPAAHALAFGLFFLITFYSDASIWFIVVYFFALPTIAALVRKLTGAQDSAGGVWGGMAGIAGLAGLASISKMLRPRGSKSSKGKTGTSAESSPAGSLAETAGSSAAVSEAQTSSAKVSSGQASRLNTFTSKAVSYGGKAAGYGLRFAGAVGGAALGYTAGVMSNNSGMMTAGTMIGGAIGHKTGHVIGKGISWTKAKAAPLMTSAIHGVSRSSAGVHQTQEMLEQEVSATDYAGPNFHFPAEYQPADAKFWSTVNLNDRYQRDYVADLVNSKKLQRHNDLEQAFLLKKKHSDYYV